MNNVVQLFRQEKTVGPSDPDTIVIFAVSDILASHADLTLTIKALSEHLDALDHITDALSDSDTRARFKQEARRSRESLTNAMLDLSPIGRQLARASAFHNV
jgi:hypothetical protein